MKFSVLPGAAHHKIVEKGWGFEVWLENNHMYCGKLLHINAGKKFSFHYHIDKDETFYVQKGRVKLIYGWDEDITKAEQVILGPDDSFRIPPRLIHQAVALADTDIFEFSTHHRDEDSYRIIKGD